MDIGIDFDGTCVTHEFPSVGKDIGAVPVLKALIANGHRLILNTMRSAGSLEDAIKWFLVNDIRLYGVQYNPTQSSWTSSNKCYAHLYIDDAALGCPLVQPLVFGSTEIERAYVDWVEIKKILIKKGLINHNGLSVKV